MKVVDVTARAAPLILLYCSVCRNKVNFSRYRDSSGSSFALMLQVMTTTNSSIPLPTSIMMMSSFPSSPSGEMAPSMVAVLCAHVDAKKGGLVLRALPITLPCVLSLWDSTAGSDRSFVRPEKKGGNMAKKGASSAHVGTGTHSSGGQSL